MKFLTNWFSREIISIVAVFSGLFLFGCFFVPSEVAAGEKQKELLFGIEPEHNIFDQVEKYQALTGYLSDQLGVKVKLTIMSRYGEAVKRFKSLHLDGAILSPFTSALAMRELYLIPIASLVNKENKSTSQGYILVRKDSGIDSVSDMRGKSVVYVDPATAEGYVFARAFFRTQGVDDPDSFFSSQVFSGSHASVIYAVLDGRADVGSAKDTVYKQLVSKDQSIQNELVIIEESPPVPEVTLCMRSDLDPDLVARIQTALLNMDQNVDGYRVLKQLEARRFISSSPSDFSIVVDMAEEAGLDTLSANTK